MTRAAALLLLLTTACTGMVTGGGGGGGSDENMTAPDAGMTAPDSAPIDATLAPGEGSIVRGMLWVTAEVPYCQAANHAHDYDSSCATTCTRPDNADWDPYRSDCSGFVSWAWDLPAPGRTTSDFAPFDTDITYAIDGSDLRPGDALNNSEHIVLFEAWTEVGKTAKFMEEPGCSSATPYAREFTADVTLDGQTVVITSHGTFTAIRYDAAP
jgi:hypothetical protein